MAALARGLALLCFLGAPPAEPARSATRWEQTLDRAVPAVVALRVSATRPFDTERAAVGVATGFVVDAERGLILTNRHVVKPGPVTAEAVFLNHERVPIHPVYRDPVHDFGFFRFDPSEVRFMEPGEIRLAPERARVGGEIRVVGNDAGEKLSILAGTLARLDREAPRYGRGRYNDFNTFYFQAASSISGGSSGAPVLDRSGAAVAVSAGANSRSSASFFLPLERVVRALEHLRAGRPVPRGTLQTVFRHQPYDELRRLGLSPETESAWRRAHPRATGMLVVSEVVPGGPGDGGLEPGDVLVRGAGRRLEDFQALEALLDDSVGRSVEWQLERGGQPQRVSLVVQDLHSVTPSAYLEYGGGVFHGLSFQQARNHGVPAAGVFVATSGYVLRRAGVPGGSVLTHLGGQQVPDLDALESVLAAQPEGAEVPARFFRLNEPNTPRVALLHTDRRWFPMQRCVRDDRSGGWPCRPGPASPPPLPREPVSTVFAAEGPRALEALAPSLVFVDVDVPFRVDGVQGGSFTGSGLVVDAEAGLVLVDRDTVPLPLADVELTFARSVSVPGRVVSIHPEHNLALVGYDPDELGDTPVRSARLAPGRLEPGESLWLVGLNRRQRAVARRTEVSGIDAASLPLPTPPRFRESNLELVAVTERVATVGGVLADKKGRVRAYWASFSTVRSGKPDSFFAGIPADLVEEYVAPHREGRPFRWASLGAELALVSVADARDLGLEEEEARRLESHDPVRRQAIAVRRLEAGTPAAERLRAGDLVLGVNGDPVSSFRELERAAQAPSVSLRLLRDGSIQALELPTVTLDGRGLGRVLAWGGALLQRPPRALARQRGMPREGVYVAATWSGSPADRHRLRPSRRVVAANGRPTPDLDAFLDAVGGLPDRGAVRLRTIDLEGKQAVLTLELDLAYWPTYELRRDAGRGWVRRPLQGPAARLVGDESRGPRASFRGSPASAARSATGAASAP